MTTNPVMSITDEQIAEIVRMNSELNELRCVVRYIRVDEVEALISRLRAAEKDAERYRFLKDKGHFRAMSIDMGGNHSWTGMGRSVGKGPTVDEAIDAAMQEQKP